MNIVSFSEARNSLKTVLDNVVDHAGVTLINRRDRENAVVMSLDYYNGMLETMHLLSTPANAQHLAQSIAQWRNGDTAERGLVDA